MSCVLGAWLVLSAALADAPKQSKAEEIADLIERLGDDDFQVREAAEVRLVKIGENAREAMERALQKNRDLEVVSRCRRLLERLPLAPAVRRRTLELIVKLGDDVYEVRESSTRELVKIGWPALKLLEAARAHPDLEVRNRAAQAIAAIRGIKR